MKNGFCLFLFLCTAFCFAEIPQSIMMESGNIRVRLDAKKRWNINRIEYCNELLGKDSSGAHYGMTCRPRHLKYAVGSGHEETGFGEKVVSIKFFADDKEVFPEKNVVIRGKKLNVEKVSTVLSLTVKYRFTIENDMIEEFAEAVSDADMNLHHLYFFMHPWEPRFTDLHLSGDELGKRVLPLQSSKTFVNRKFVPAAAFYDKKSGFGVVTVYRNLKGGKQLMRFIWDRPQYRKDYLCDYFMSVLPKGHIIAYESKTGFFCQSDREKLHSEVEKSLKKLENK
ncbi:MAG: hypothetical protein IKB25_13165 [Lentisphaeria bacterium]|nr:hypothetical protein [Lentisphaeria bacterium]